MDPSHFGLTRNPFEREPSVDEACLPPPFHDLLRGLMTPLQHPRSISVVTGEPGSGKTMLVSVLAAALGRGAAVARITVEHPHLDAVLRSALAQLEPRLVPVAGFMPTTEILAQTAASRWESRIATVLVVDDAHRLNFPAIDELCRNGGVHVVLCGRPALLKAVERVLPGVGIHGSGGPIQVQSLAPLPRELARNYLEDRIVASGGRVAGLFTLGALSRLLEGSGGFVGRLEALASAALSLAQDEGQVPVGTETIEQVLAAQDAGAETPPPAPPDDAPSVSPPPWKVHPEPTPASFPPDPPPPAPPPPPPPRPAPKRRGPAPRPDRRRAAGGGPPKRTSPLRPWHGVIAGVLVSAAWLAYSYWDGLDRGPGRDVAAGHTPGSGGPGPAPPGVEASPADPGPVRSGTEWVVQVGAFRSLRNAQEVVESLRSVDPGATIREQGELYCVVTGSFANREEATAFAPTVRGTGLPAYVRRWTGEG